MGSATSCMPPTPYMLLRLLSIPKKVLVVRVCATSQIWVGAPISSDSIGFLLRPMQQALLSKHLVILLMHLSHIVPASSITILNLSCQCILLNLPLRTRSGSALNTIHRLGTTPTLSAPKHLTLRQSLMPIYLNLQVALILCPSSPAVALSLLSACSTSCTKDSFSTCWRSCEATKEVWLLWRARPINQVGLRWVSLVALLRACCTGSSTRRPGTRGRLATHPVALAWTLGLKVLLVASCMCLRTDDAGIVDERLVLVRHVIDIQCTWCAHSEPGSIPTQVRASTSQLLLLLLVRY